MLGPADGTTAPNDDARDLGHADGACMSDLLIRARAGDRAAARRLHELARPFILKISTSVLRHHDDAEDAVQDIIFKILRRSDHPDHFWPWLRATTHNHCLNLLRSRMRDAAGFGDDQAPRLPAVATGIATRAHRRESRRQMSERIDALPVELMEVVLFHYGPAGLSRPEIAEMLGVAESEVRRRLDHARQLLKAG